MAADTLGVLLSDHHRSRRATGADLELALALAETGARLARRRFDQGRLHVSLKPDGALVSDVDMAVEHEIRARLELERPDDGVIGEEFGVTGNRRNRWVIDPICGTHNLVRGDPRWAVMVALEVGGRLEAGVVAAPALGRCWWAARGMGAFADGRPMHRRWGSGVAAARLTARASRELVRLGPAHPLTRHLGGLRVVTSPLPWPELAVADGSADIDLRLDARPWELAALGAILTEAGGAVTDLRGALRIDGGSALVARAGLHAELLGTAASRVQGPARTRRAAVGEPTPVALLG
ncbi:MAG: inositol monophosphatase [Candidatus Dormibacteria bacterium]|jgi:histidinol-phosphatase